MKQHLISLLSKVPGNGGWSNAIRDNLNTPDCDEMLGDLRSAALDNGGYFEKLLGKEAYELLLEMEFEKAEI